MNRFVTTLAAVVCLAVVTSLADQDSDSAAREYQAVRLLLDRGSYDEAERRATGLWTMAESARGLDSLELARASDLLVEALLGNGKAASPRTLDLAQRAVVVKERELGTDHPEVAVSLHNLGGLRHRRGEFRAALPLHERARDLHLRGFGPDSSQRADSLDAIAGTLIELERFQDAQAELVESLRIRELFSNSPIRLARTLELTASVHFWAGRYSLAVPLLDRVLEFWNHEAPNHPDKIVPLIERGRVAILTGDVPDAYRWWTAAVDLAKDALRPEHPLRARAEVMLAWSLHARGNATEARRLRENSLRIGESLPPCDPDLTLELNEFANSLVYFRDYLAARRLYERRLSILEKCGGSADKLATTLINLSFVAKSMGAHREAEVLATRALRLWSDAFGPDHPYVAFALDDLASVHVVQYNYTRAITLLERALRIRRTKLGSRHADVAQTLVQLAAVLGQTGQMARATGSIEEGIGILERTQSANPGALGSALITRGTLERRRGNYPAARASFAEALAARERTHGAAHPLSAEVGADVGYADFALGKYGDALTRGLRAEQAGRDLLRFTIGGLPERRAMEFAAKRPRGLDLVLSVAVGGDVDDASAVLDAVIQSRGVILDELAARARSTSGGDPTLTKSIALLASARERYASLMMRTFEGGVVPSTMLEAARREKETAEEALVGQSAATRAELTRARSGLGVVQQALPRSPALLSFVRYDRTTFTKNGERTLARVTPSYVAFVTRGGEPVVAVPLGPASLMEAAIAAWRAQVSTPGTTGTGAAPADPEAAYRVAGARLRARLWDPIAPLLLDVGQVFIVPDGAISTVSFASLPVPGRKYLIETAPLIHYLSTERDLIVDAQASGRGLLAVGGPDYATASQAPAKVRGLECGPTGPLTFEDLPGTRAEVQDIARLWAPRSAGQSEGRDAEPSLVLSGSRATKAAVMQAAAGRRVVHLATHGFFLGSSCEARPASTRSVGGLVATSRQPVDNPLLLAGLAFAGANRRDRQSPAGAGILTAEEVVSLNLHGTEWAVLSACDTGLGEIKAGEGVFGLRRAFQIAGVRTVIMSLWSVEDQSTRLWMTALYQGRLEGGLTTAEAVRAAGLQVLRERRARARGAHPFYWAGFVAAGDWR